MDVIIKGMKMPKSCDDCNLLYDYCCCIVTGRNLSTIDWKVEEKRLPNCPLIELPDHGDLIDRDALMKKHSSFVWAGDPAVENIKGAPVIIPAERSEDND